MTVADLLSYLSMAVAAVLFAMAIFASKLPEPFRRHRKRLVIGALAAVFALPIVDVAFNWTEAVALVKAEWARLEQAPAAPSRP